MASRFHGGGNRRLEFLQLQRHIDEYVPKVYASIGSELWQMGWSKEEINDLFNKSRERWEQSFSPCVRAGIWYRTLMK